MRVLHIAHSIAGGPASYFEEIAGFQTATLGVNSVRFLIPSGSIKHISNVRVEQVMEFTPIQRDLLGLCGFALASSRAIRTFRPTVVHLHSTFSGAIIRPLIKIQSSKVAVVYCAHGWSFEMETSIWKKHLYTLIEWSLSHITDKIINISDTDHTLTKGLGFPEGRMTVIKNGVAAEPPIVSECSAAFPPEKIHLIFVGRHDRQKGLDFLLEAFRRVSSTKIQLHVVGGPVVGSQSIGADSIPSGVTFYGWISRNQVSAMISRSDALIMPSRWEGLPLTALEAMRLGKPVLASRRGVLTEIVSHGKTGLHFSIEDIGELINLLETLDRSVLRKLGDAARASFQDSYTAERMNTDLLSLYRSLQSSKGLSRDS